MTSYNDEDVSSGSTDATTDEAQNIAERSNNSASEQPEDTDCRPAQTTRFIDRLAKIAINDKVDELRKQARDTTYIAGRLAIAGQITVFYAGPNTGKTLLIMRLVAEAKENQTIGQHLYHINLDDTFEGQITKADLGNRHGILEIVPAQFPKPQENFTTLVEALVAEGSAGEAVLILDTIKKFVDVMDKKASSHFMTTCRRFTSAGGSIIALAHVNKNTDSAENAIPAGTSDIRDDCDCAYIMTIVGEETVPNGKKTTVEFRNSKTRGPVVEEALYSYVKNNDGDYDDMFYSVKLIDGTEADQIRITNALKHEQANDQSMISEISALLKDSAEMTQKEIVAMVSGNGAFPRRKVIACLQRWSCPPDDGGLWSVSRGDRNSRIYKLIQ